MMKGLATRMIAALACVAMLVSGKHALAEIDVMLLPDEDIVNVGDTIEVAVYVFSDSSEDQLLAAAEVILSWETDKVQLLGNHQDGAVGLLSSTFPVNHPSGLNEENPPQNGIGIYVAWAPLGQPVAATPDGTLLTTLVFEALSLTEATPIDIVPVAGDPKDPDAMTIVFDGTTPNTDVTGMLIGTAIAIVSDCPGDIDQNGFVNVDDLLIVLNNWGFCADCSRCVADVTGDCTVNVDDLLIVLNNWGPCSGTR